MRYRLRMRRQNLRSTIGDDVGDDDSQPVMVPRSDRTLAATSPERARRLRKHLVMTLRKMKGRAHPVSPLRPEPVGFAARVAHAACSLCKGWCCKGGGDHAFLDGPTIARVRSERPELDTHAVVRLYGERVPVIGYEDSCVFHGKHGCTLDRSLRSDVCNSYFCSGLHSYMTGSDAATSVVVIAGEGGKIHTSRVLPP